MNYSIVKLSDEAMRQSGGLGDYDGITMLGFAASCITAPVAFGCSVARIVKNAKAQKAVSAGDTKTAEKYKKDVQKLDVAVATTSGLAAAGLITTVVGSYASSRYSCPSTY